MILSTLSPVCNPLSDQMIKRRRTKWIGVVRHTQLTVPKHQRNNKVSIPVILCGPIITKVFSMLIKNVSLLNSEMIFTVCLFNTSFCSMQKLLYKAHCLIFLWSLNYPHEQILNTYCTQYFTFRLSSA